MARNLPHWIQGYLAYTAEQESPELYHTWTAVSAIAGALRRRVWFDQKYFIMYPNVYIVLVSPPGKCKKSTAMRIARNHLGKIPGINFTVDSTSRERLIQDLSQIYADGQSAMTAYASEFASLVSTSQMDMVVFLTDIFDSPDEWTHKTKGGGTNKIKMPYLNLIAGTTPDWLARAMPLDTIGIGLTSRVIFVYAERPRMANPFPDPSKEQKELSGLLVEDLHDIAQMSGEFVFEPQAKEAYAEWYRSRLEDDETGGDPRLIGYYSRKDVHLLKLCMIVSASRSSDTVITMEDYETAQAMLEHVEQFMPRVFAHVGRNPLNLEYEHVISMLAAHPNGLPKSTILDALKFNARKEEVDEVLDTLVQIGSVQFRDKKFYLIDG